MKISRQVLEFGVLFTIPVVGIYTYGYFYAPTKQELNEDLHIRYKDSIKRAEENNKRFFEHLKEQIDKK
eukprot:snap_masked-scaffold_17-processed-gene-2.24-mRNA-1 protein AED:1.00 eAED:1.00 QI:0/-1/0/0/-1/1/1/0/68